MAELVDSLEDIEDLNPKHYRVAMEEGFIDLDTDVENAIIFTPDTGKWCWKAGVEVGDRAISYISVYWTVRDPGATISIVNPSASKRERDGVVRDALKRAKAKRARVRDDIRLMIEDGILPPSAAECETYAEAVAVHRRELQD